MFPLEFLRLYFFATDLAITFLPSFTVSALSLAVSFSSFVLVYQVFCNKVYHKIDGLKKSIVSLHSEGQRSENKVFVGLCFLLRLQGRWVASSSFSWFTAILGISWLVAISLQTLPLCLYGAFLCVSMCPHNWHFSFCVSMCRLPSSFKDTSHWFRACPYLVWYHFNFVAFAKTLLLKKVPFWDSRWTCVLREHYQVQQKFTYAE